MRNSRLTKKGFLYQRSFQIRPVPSATMAFRYLFICDLEATCDMASPGHERQISKDEHEIIEVRGLGRGLSERRRKERKNQTKSRRRRNATLRAVISHAPPVSLCAVRHA